MDYVYAQPLAMHAPQTSVLQHAKPFLNLRIHCFEIKCMRGNTNTDVVVARQEMAMRSGLDLFGDVCQCHGAVTGRIVDEFDVCESNVKRL